MSWLFEWIFEGVMQEIGEAIHRRHGWGGCLSVLLAIAILVAAVLWLAGAFPNEP